MNYDNAIRRILVLYIKSVTHHMGIKNSERHHFGAIHSHYKYVIMTIMVKKGL